MFFLNFLLIIVLLLNSVFIFINEEFIIFISLCFFFLFLFKILQKSISKYFFFRVEFLYFSFFYLITASLILLGRLRMFFSFFIYRFLVNYCSELPFVNMAIFIKFANLQIKFNLLFMRSFIFRFIFNIIGFLKFSFFSKLRKCFAHLFFSFANYLLVSFFCKI